MNDVNSETPVTPEPAATVMLLRDGENGLQVFMVVRNKAIKFASGAVVFPGGKVDDEDADPRFLPHTQGAQDLTDGERALRIGAIREVFEETGVLLARKRGEHVTLSGAAASAIETRYRARLLAGDVNFITIVTSEDLELLAGDMVRYAHWVTPRVRPIRFDTHFYLMALPPGQSPNHDGEESVASLWMTADNAKAEMNAGGYAAMAPTHLNLGKVGRHASVADALAAARSATVVTVEPQVREEEDGTRTVHIPAEADYEISSYPYQAGWIKSQ